MKFILSPARKIAVLPANHICTTPLFKQETTQIINCLKAYSPWDLDTVYRQTNEKILHDTFCAIHAFQLDANGAPALLAYQGLVYQYLKPETLSPAALAYAKDCLRILSALYGILRPFDAIYPYRLEMTNKLNINGKNLYQFWDNKIYQALYQENEPVVNLASEEYAKTVRKFLNPDNLFLDIEFLHSRQGKYKTVTTKAKMARGLMARFILENQIKKLTALKEFTDGNYHFEKSLSNPQKYVFIASEE